jgi:hypothetical protein
VRRAGSKSHIHYEPWYYGNYEGRVAVDLKSTFVEAGDAIEIALLAASITR